MPSQYPQNVVTKNGLAMIAESVATRKNLIFTRVVVGDGDATGRNFNDMTSVISPKMELPVTSGVNEGNGQYLITATLSNNTLNVGFFPREVGLYAKVDGKTEMLYSYTNGGNNVGYVPDKTTPIDSEIYKIRTVIGNAKNVTFKFVDSTFVTKGELDLHNSDINAHEAQFRRYLPLTGGTVTGDVSLDGGSWVLFKTGNNSAGIRVTPNGIMDIGINKTGAVDSANLCVKNRPGWYSPGIGTKQLAITADISNHNTDETAHQPITDAIAKILGASNWKENPAATLKDIKKLLGVCGIVAQRLEVNGFVKFANGFTIQWGTQYFGDIDGNAKTVSTTFPTGFQNKPLAIVLSAEDSNLDISAITYVAGKTSTGFVIRGNEWAHPVQTLTVNWIAVGV